MAREIAQAYWKPEPPGPEPPVAGFEQNPQLALASSRPTAPSRSTQAHLRLTRLEFQYQQSGFAAIRNALGFRLDHSHRAGGDTRLQKHPVGKRYREQPALWLAPGMGSRNVLAGGPRCSQQTFLR